MAKQTFTTGQVLTAAQMTSLQQTAMGGGSATAKTASYVLVAADAGTTVAMNAAGATTITVNTGLFAAGDTVFIQNLGAGACTVTAGTATVATAGSLILPQNDAGILYFTATGASIFYDYIQAGAVSPLTTKGDLYTFSTSDARLGVGTNTYVLTADSAEATGLKWAAPAAGAGLVKIQTNTFTTASSSSFDNVFTATYRNYRIIINITNSSTGLDVDLRLRVSGSDNTSSNYFTRGITTGDATTTNDSTSSFKLGNMDSSEIHFVAIDITSPQIAVKTRILGLIGENDSTGPIGRFNFGNFNATTAFDGFTILTSTGTITGTATVYGWDN